MILKRFPKEVYFSILGLKRDNRHTELLLVLPYFYASKNAMRKHSSYITHKKYNTCNFNEKKYFKKYSKHDFALTRINGIYFIFALNIYIIQTRKTR
jgi:hypothetical protein